MAVRDLVVVGASRGGLDALRRLLASLPARFPAAMLIVLHTHPRSPGLLAGILQRYTRRSVSYPAQGEEMRLGEIYLAPADHHLVVTASGHMGLDSGPKVRHSRPAADRLFQSAAEVYGRRVIGVVLTGGDHDGTDGLLAIKAAGGLSVVQQPVDATDPSMPVSAIASDEPDYCVSLDELGALLTELVAGDDVRPSPSCKPGENSGSPRHLGVAV